MVLPDATRAKAHRQKIMIEPRGGEPAEGVLGFGTVRAGGRRRSAAVLSLVDPSGAEGGCGGSARHLRPGVPFSGAYFPIVL